MATNWCDVPAKSGVYWAYSATRCKGGPTLCRVNILEDGRWSATFLAGVQPYVFRSGCGWLWKPVQQPAAPRGKRT